MISRAFSRDDPAVGQLDDQVDLVATVALSQVVDPRCVFGDGQLRAKLCQHERLDHPAEQVWIT